MQQLLENLFRNAIEHGGPDVTVRVEPMANGFAVADDGPGIPPAGYQRVFDVGYTTAEDGTGCGSRIVRQIVDAHGWDIS
ncbi:histidine kinase, partial [Halobacteriales archaeon QS_5_70_17]